MVDMGVFALEAARQPLTISVEAGFAWKLAKLAKSCCAEVACRACPRRLHNSKTAAARAGVSAESMTALYCARQHNQCP